MTTISCGTIAKAVHNKIMEKVSMVTTCIILIIIFCSKEVLVHEKRLHHINRDITILKDKIK